MGNLTNLMRWPSHAWFDQTEDGVISEESPLTKILTYAYSAYTPNKHGTPFLILLAGPMILFLFNFARPIQSFDGLRRPALERPENFSQFGWDEGNHPPAHHAENEDRGSY